MPLVQVSNIASQKIERVPDNRAPVVPFSDVPHPIGEVLYQKQKHAIAYKLIYEQCHGIDESKQQSTNLAIVNKHYRV